MHELVAERSSETRGRDATTPGVVGEGVNPHRFVLHHLPALDGLRGLAVAGVLAFHGDHLVGGYLGVDLFFVLSGFLITSLLLREGDGTGSIALGAFWARRARRLLPALFGLLAGIVLFALVWATPFELGALRTDALASVFYVANWQAIWSGHGYWDLFTTPSPLQHTWSLAIEEQFYLVWPLVVLALIRVRRRAGASLAPAVLVLAGAVAVLSVAWMVVRYEPGTDPSRVYFGTDTRMGSILLGAALAAWLAWRGTVRSPAARRGLEVAGVVGIAWLGYAWSHVEGQSAFLYRGGFLLSALAVLAVIAAASHPQRGPLAGVLSIAPLRGLGVISYGLYLWHWPVFVVLQLQHTAWGLDGWPLFVVQVAVSLALALVSFFVIERPIRERGLAAWGPRGAVLLPGTAVAVLLAVMAATTGAQARPEFAYGGDPTGNGAVVTRDTLPVVPDDPTSTLPPVGDPAAGPVPTTSGPSPSAPGHDTPAPTPGTVARPAGRAPRLLVVGDSVAVYLGEGFARQPDLHIQLGSQAMYKCTLGRQYSVWKRRDGIPDTENADCRRWPTIWGDAVRDFKPDAVLLLFGGPPQGTLNIGDGWFEPCSAEYQAYQRGEVDAAIDVLAARGAIVFLAPAAHPRFPFLPNDIDARTDCVNRVYREAAAARPDKARILALDDWTCPPPGQECVDEIGGAKLREDGIHYRDAGADAAARWAAGQIFTP